MKELLVNLVVLLRENNQGLVRMETDLEQLRIEKVKSILIDFNRFLLLRLSVLFIQCFGSI